MVTAELLQGVHRVLQTVGGAPRGDHGGDVVQGLLAQTEQDADNQPQQRGQTDGRQQSHQSIL